MTSSHAQKISAWAFGRAARLMVLCAIFFLWCMLIFGWQSNFQNRFGTERTLMDLLIAIDAEWLSLTVGWLLGTGALFLVLAHLVGQGIGAIVYRENDKFWLFGPLAIIIPAEVAMTGSVMFWMMLGPTHDDRVDLIPPDEIPMALGIYGTLTLVVGAVFGVMGTWWYKQGLRERAALEASGSFVPRQSENSIGRRKWLFSQVIVALALVLIYVNNRAVIHWFQGPNAGPLAARTQFWNIIFWGLAAAVVCMLVIGYWADRRWQMHFPKPAIAWIVLSLPPAVLAAVGFVGAEMWGLREWLSLGQVGDWLLFTKEFLYAILTFLPALLLLNRFSLMVTPHVGTQHLLLPERLHPVRPEPRPQ